MGARGYEDGRAPRARVNDANANPDDGGIDETHVAVNTEVGGKRKLLTQDAARPAAPVLDEMDVTSAPPVAYYPSPRPGGMLEAPRVHHSDEVLPSRKSTGGGTSECESSSAVYMDEDPRHPHDSTEDVTTEDSRMLKDATGQRQIARRGDRRWS